MGSKDEKLPPLARRNKTRSILYFATTLGSILILVIHLVASRNSKSISAWVFDPLPIYPINKDTTQQKKNKNKLRLRHVYHRGTTGQEEVHKVLDITPNFIETNSLHTMDLNNIQYDWPVKYKHQSPWTVELPFNSNQMTLKRLADRDPESIESYLNYAREVGSEEISKIHLDWKDDEIIAPNVTDKETIITLALMSSNAYVEIPETGDWRDVGWNKSTSHGWNGTGLRGQIFVSDDNSTVVIAYKGTSASYLGNTGDDTTSVEDKNNDNLLFSCCCARVSYMWTTVCDCYEKSYTCNQKCLERELVKKDRYYQAAMDVYKNVTKQYPNSNIWVTGHSLGGALSSLIGRTYGVPAVSFEAPGELLATKRLHLPMPPGLPKYMEGIWHFGHTADPIFMGVCNGASSACSVAGYAMETQCHSGKQCVYDVVTDKGWHVNMLNHRIHTVIDEILEVYNDTAPCIDTPPCRDCFNWNYVDDKGKGGKDDKNSKSTISTSTSSKTSEISTPTPTKEPKCVKWTWYGRCYEWEDDDGHVEPSYS
ncbi:putative lipase [Wickerhamomyces ciferrii]|uniref:Putative lipase ATG15 n=1 Tax=Wickerhamomyces ciferrii (strain ATCC 14091 / BCRC 22168 / CBS 111 / JCM 3599 / NBRC 0793 / NRRL Y-1031 F-60-10) TaxID=1206466 RepID=K0KJT8_WICCF|nr:putative lipase [Wickerhamomyces ciferrii]CCH41368.1 putative lipase [Wickerhamomyces ciferrii]